jgi:glycosyltransferase involved in cell wall biosynthesis
MRHKRLIFYASAINKKTGGSYSILKELLAQSEVSSTLRITLIGPEESRGECSEKGIDFIPLNHNNKWLKRFLWEYLFAKYLIRVYKDEELTFFSLQNSIPRLPKEIKKIIYLHQPLPYETRLKVPIRHFKNWLKQKLYPFFIQLNIDEGTIFIVQTKWMAKSISLRHKLSSSNILIHHPSIPKDLPKLMWRGKGDSEITLFYPAKYYYHKNHSNLIAALQSVDEALLGDRKLILKLTLNDDEFDKLTNKFSVDSNKIKIVNLKFLTREQVFFELVSSSCLIFPSMTETFGLPLIEAMKVGAPVLASDLDYAREVLEGYHLAMLFDPLSALDIARCIMRFIKLNSFAFVSSEIESVRDPVPLFEIIIKAITKQ